MLNPISEMFRNIKKEKALFFSSLISLIVVFTLLDILLVFFYNLNDFKAKLDKSNQVIIYVKTMAEPEISDFQKKLYSIKGVKAVKFESKEKAIEKLEEEMDVDLGNEENPLDDSFYVYVDGNSDIKAIRTELSKLPEINETDIQPAMIEKSAKFNKTLDNILIYGLAGIGIFAVILIYNLTSFGIKARKGDVKTLTHIGVSNNYIRFTYFLEGIFLVGLASMIGFLIFLKLYDFIIQGVNFINSNLIMRSSRGELQVLFVISLLIGIFITAVVNFFSTRRYLKFDKR